MCCLGVIRCNVANVLFILVLTFVQSALCARVCMYDIWLVLWKTFSITPISKLRSELQIQFTVYYIHGLTVLLHITKAVFVK